MAISDAGQICEFSGQLISTYAMTLSGSVAAGGLMTLGIGGRRAGGSISIVSISDSKGHVWDWAARNSNIRYSAVAWAKATVPLTSGVDTITVQLNAQPSKIFITGHAFTNASGTPTHEVSDANIGTVASATVNVVGSDFLVLATVTIADEGVTTTALNSMVEQDTYDDLFALTIDFLSRNHTSGSTFQAGTTLGSSEQWAVVAVSFPFAGGAAAGGRSGVQMIGAV